MPTQPNPARPQSCTHHELCRVGVRQVATLTAKVILACEKCGEQWHARRTRGGRLRRGYWRCPSGCNRHM